MTDGEKRAYLLTQGWEYKAEGGPDTLAWWKDGIFWYEVKGAWQAQLELDAALGRTVRAMKSGTALWRYENHWHYGTHWIGVAGDRPEDALREAIHGNVD